MKTTTAKLSKGRYEFLGTVIVRNDPPRNTGHHLVTTWRDERTGKLLGYTLREAKDLVAIMATGLVTLQAA
jgi:hypothetical protein